MSLYRRLQGVRKRPADSSENKALLDPYRVGGEEKENGFGTYVMIEKEHQRDHHFVNQDPFCLYENLKLLYGIGPVTEKKLKEEGYRSIKDLTEHPKWKKQALSTAKCIEAGDIQKIRSLGAKDWDMLPFFDQEDIVFLDIETTGLWSTQPLFLVGILFWHQNRLISRQFFARQLYEEKPLLARLTEDLEGFSVIVTYNGKKFDIPYIEGRTVAHRLFYRSVHEQVDLLYHARRHFRDVFPDCRLTTIEEYLLRKKRTDDIPGHLIPKAYYQFIKTQDAQLMDRIIKHNKEDLLAMADMFGIVQENFERVY